MKTREVVALVEDLRRQGWRVEESNSGPGHYSAFPPDKTKPPFHFSGSGDRRAYLNTLSKLRQLGYNDEGDTDEKHERHQATRRRRSA